MLVKVTLPVAVVVVVFLPVALNVPNEVKSWLSWTAGTTPATGSAAVAVGSARIVSWSGPTGSTLALIVIEALGRTTAPIRPSTTSSAARAIVVKIRAVGKRRPRVAGRTGWTAAAPERATDPRIGRRPRPERSPLVRAFRRRPGHQPRRRRPPRLIGSTAVSSSAERLAPGAAAAAPAAIAAAPGAAAAAGPPTWSDWLASYSPTVAKTGSPAEAARARAAGSGAMIERARLRSSASRASNRKLIREVAIRDPAGTTSPTRGSSDVRILAAADVISSSTSR